MEHAGTERSVAPEPTADARLGDERGHLTSTVKHTLVYGLGTLAAKAIGFLMIPIYTRFLTPADYGTLELLSMTVDLLAFTAGLGLSWAVTRYYYAYDDPRERGTVVSTAATLMAALFALATALALPLAPRLAQWLLADARHAHLVRLALGVLLVFGFLEVPLAYLRARQDSVAFVRVSLTRFGLALVLNVVFVAFLRMGVAGVLYSTLLSSTAVSVYLWGRTIRETGYAFSPRIARRLVRFGAPMVATELGSFVLHYSDRYFLRVYDSLAGVGLYSLAYKFAMLLALFIANPFAQIWIPKALEIEKTEGPRAPAALREILSHYNVVLVSASLGIALFADDAIVVMAGSEFHPAGAIVPWLCLGILFFGYRPISQVGACIRERSDLIAAGVACGTLVVVVGNLTLIPRWGVFGAAVATFLAFASEFAVLLALSERVYPLRFGIVQLLRPLLLGAVVYGAARWAVPSDWARPWATAADALAWLAFVAAAIRIEGMWPRLRAASRRALRAPHELWTALRSPV
jgi:O-antigen/teichoic acid export membrane protein